MSSAARPTVKQAERHQSKGEYGMTKRVLDQSATTDTPTLHGHYDGPRGHQDEHRHLGGDRQHPHPDRQALGRVVAAEEYVPPAQLADARRKLKDAADRKLAEAESRVGRVIAEANTDQLPKIAPVGAAVVKGNGRNPTDIAFGDLIEIVTHAETQRFEGQTTIELLSLLDAVNRAMQQALEQEKARQLVDTEIIRRLPGVAREFQLLAEGWAAQRGIKDGGS